MPAHPSRAGAAYRAALLALACVTSSVRSADAGEKARPVTVLRAPTRAAPVADAAHATWVSRDASAVGAAVPVVYLHGIHGRPENGCPWFTAPSLGEVLCPTAARSEPYGTFSWSGTRADEDVVAETSALATARAGAASLPLLVGFSQGAYVAARVVPRLPGRFRGLVLVGADAQLDARVLVSAGITRVALLAGDYDAASAPMRRTQGALLAAGYDARFVSLGRVGHTYVPDSESKLAELRSALAWAAGASSTGS